MRVRAANPRKRDEVQCPLCRDRLTVGDEIHECGACHTRYHHMCALELGGCGTAGCAERGAAPGPPEVLTGTGLEELRRQLLAQYRATIARYGGFVCFALLSVALLAGAIETGSQFLTLTGGTLAFTLSLVAVGTFYGWLARRQHERELRARERRSLEREQVRQQLRERLEARRRAREQDARESRERVETPHGQRADADPDA